MRILFVSVSSPFNKGLWSGVPAYMLEAMIKTGVDVEIASPLMGVKANHFTRLLGLWPRFQSWRCAKMKSGFYEGMRDPVVCGLWAHEVRRHIRRVKPDVVFSYSSLPVAKLRTEIPIVIWPDATFDGLLGFYYTNNYFAPVALRNGNQREQEALTQASAIVYNSEWAAETARRYYQVDHAKIHVIPYGSNLSDPPSQGEVEESIARRISTTSPCRLLFVGQDWIRKGGDKAVAVAEELNRQGVQCVLTVVGHQAPRAPYPSFLCYEGFLRKDVVQENLRLRQLLSQSHFLIGPSVAECGGSMVFSEGAAFGVPALTTNVGGISTQIKDGVNGRMFTPTATPVEYAKFISEMLSDMKSFLELCRASRRDYETRQNWQTACSSLVKLCETLIV